MIKMQVGVDDDIDIFRRNAACGEIVEQLRRLSVKLDHALRKLVAHPGFDQHILLTRPDEQRVESGGHIVFIVGRRLARPHHFGYDPKKSAPVERISPVRKSAEFKIAKRELMHQSSVPHGNTSVHPRVRVKRKLGRRGVVLAGQPRRCGYAGWGGYDSGSSRWSLRLSASRAMECIRFCRVTMPIRR